MRMRNAALLLGALAALMPSAETEHSYKSPGDGGRIKIQLHPREYERRKRHRKMQSESRKHSKGKR